MVQKVMKSNILECRRRSLEWSKVNLRRANQPLWCGVELINLVCWSRQRQLPMAILRSQLARENYVWAMDRAAVSVRGTSPVAAETTLPSLRYRE
mmetsp:Transcript_29757/g.72323  ORF Transcript_29757/g.72323 Transcript_29757/m.72323 type:complete len:95 (-) Transcript_29757:629-913(-)